MRDYQAEYEGRVAFIRELVKNAGASGIVYGNSGGKDSALVGILCKAACDNTVGIETRTVDLTAVREREMEELQKVCTLNSAAINNIAPRLRMMTLYAIGAAENRLVAGTGNRSEIHMGYFTKWGDGASDFDVIADLTATEVFEFLEYLNAPRCIIDKAPSAGLFDGQTDEQEMGVTYKAIDDFLLYGTVNAQDKAVIDRYHNRSEHKRKPLVTYKG